MSVRNELNSTPYYRSVISDANNATLANRRIDISASPWLVPINSGIPSVLYLKVTTPRLYILFTDSASEDVKTLYDASEPTTPCLWGDASAPIIASVDTFGKKYLVVYSATVAEIEVQAVR